jgi:hypothetical protein
MNEDNQQVNQEEDLKTTVNGIKEQLSGLAKIVENFILHSSSDMEKITGDMAALNFELRMQETETGKQLARQEEVIKRLSEGGGSNPRNPSVTLDTNIFTSLASPTGSADLPHRRESIITLLQSQGVQSRNEGAIPPMTPAATTANNQESKDEEQTGPHGYDKFFGLHSTNRLSTNKQLQVSVAVQEIKPEDKEMQTISTNSVLRAVEKFREYRSISSAHDLRGFDEFISHQVQRLLIDNEKSLDVPFSTGLSYDSFSSIKQKDILCMTARYIRSQNVKKTEFIKVFIKGLRELELEKNERGNWEVQANGWSRHAQKPLSEWIQRAYDVHFFLTCGTVRHEILPNETYAKDPDVGLIRIAIGCLGKLKDTAVMFIGEAVLKKLTTFPEFLVELKKMNEEMQRTDRRIMQQNARITPVIPYNELVSSTLQSLSNLKARREHYDSRKKEIETDQRKTFTGHNTARSGFAGNRFNRLEVGADSDEDENELHRGALVYPEEDTNSDNGTEQVLVNKSHSDATQDSRSDSYGMVQAIDDDVRAEAFNRMEYAEKGSAHKSLTDPKLLVCFEKIDKGRCEIKDCKYNHKTEDCRNHVIKAFLKASRSPLLTSDELGKFLAQAKSPTQSQTGGLPTTSAIPRFSNTIRSGGGAGGLRNTFPHTSHVKEMVSQDNSTTLVPFSQDN